MESGSVKKAFIFGIIMILAVLAVVFAANGDRLGGKKSGTDEQSSSSDGTSDTDQVGSDLNAFMNDDSFFDSSSAGDVTMQYGKKVSLVINSVNQDLRVMIIDEIGRLVTGAEFEVEVKGQDGTQETCIDDDKDGIIYIDHLRAENYDVSLLPLDGYLIADSTTSIEVRKQLEYAVLSNIKYLILDADQVDAKKDDTEVRDAESDDDKTDEKTEITDLNGTAGIDVSSWNKKIDWQKVADSGVKFAIIRCGYRGASSGSLVKDECFEDNIAGAQMHGIKTGIYFYTQALTEAEAVEEASMACSLVEKYKLDLPIYVDSELSSGGNGRADDLTKDERTQNLLAFMKTVESTGNMTGIYGSANWFKNRVDMSNFDKYHIWLAQYRDAPDYDGSYDMWQYSSKGKVDGIETNVDLDTSYMKDTVVTKNNADNNAGNNADSNAGNNVDSNAGNNADSNAGNNADSNAENQQ